MSARVNWVQELDNALNRKKQRVVPIITNPVLYGAERQRGSYEDLLRDEFAFVNAVEQALLDLPIAGVLADPAPWTLTATALGAEVEATPVGIVKYTSHPVTAPFMLFRVVRPETAPMAPPVQRMMRTLRILTERLGKQCAVFAAVSGPISTAVGLFGFDKFVEQALFIDEGLMRLRRKIEELKQYGVGEKAEEIAEERVLSLEKDLVKEIWELSDKLLEMEFEDEEDRRAVIDGQRRIRAELRLIEENILRKLIACAVDAEIRILAAAARVTRFAALADVHADLRFVGLDPLKRDIAPRLAYINRVLRNVRVLWWLRGVSAFPEPLRILELVRRILPHFGYVIEHHEMEAIGVEKVAEAVKRANAPLTVVISPEELLELDLTQASALSKQLLQMIGGRGLLFYIPLLPKETRPEVVQALAFAT